jgi:hypothetical protein
MESLLHGVQLTIVDHALDRGDFASVRLDREDCARLHTQSVEVHRAGTAAGRVASDQRADLAESLAQILHQQCSRLDVIAVGDAVNG